MLCFCLFFRNPTTIILLKRFRTHRGGFMNRTIALLCLMVFAAAGVSNAVIPIADYGSNPYFSTELYPQDLMLRSGNYLFYSPEYQKNPWWGDIDEPARKPATNTDYTITGKEIVDENGYFKYSGNIYSVNNNLGYAYRINENLMSSFKLNYNIDALQADYEGVMTGNEAYAEANGKIPIDYSSRHTFNEFSIEGMIGTKLFDMPFGVKIDGGVETTLGLNSNLELEILDKIDSSTYDPDKYVKLVYKDEQVKLGNGPSEVGCSHPTGVRGTQADWWQQYEYAIGPVYHIDILAGLTHPNVKGGFYSRFKWGHQERYQWETDPDRYSEIYEDDGFIDSTIARNFIGEYVKQDMAGINHAYEGRLFGNINLHSNDRFALKTFVAVEYLDSTTGSAAAENLEAVSGSKETIHSVAIECHPNISTKLGPYLNFIDAALITRYHYTRYNNNTEAWLNGGRVMTYRNTSVGTDPWNDNWSGFSYANENGFDIGADIAAMFPLFSGANHYLGLNLRLFGEGRFTYQSKYYGENVQAGSSNQFTVNNIRKNFAREVFFNSFLMLHYQFGPYQLRLQVNEPVLYSIAPKTQLKDGRGNTVGDELSKAAQLITADGMNIGLYGSYDVVLPFLR
jgi:hypothetical protein